MILVENRSIIKLTIITLALVIIVQVIRRGNRSMGFCSVKGKSEYCLRIYCSYVCIGLCGSQYNIA